MTELLSSENIDKEILPFLDIKARVDLRCISIQYFLGLTGTLKGRRFISARKHKYLAAIMGSTRDDQWAIAKDAYLALVNLSCDDFVADRILDLDEAFPEQVLRLIMSKECPDMNVLAMLLSNISRTEANAKRIHLVMEKHGDTIGLDKLVTLFCLAEPSIAPKLHYLAPFMSNLTQIRANRHHILNPKGCVLQRLLPFLRYKDSAIRRGGVAGILRNLCFECSYHEWIMGTEVNILSFLLLPLAAGGEGQEGFNEEEMERLPMDLQYLDDSHKRETDPDIRLLILECMYQLCSSKFGRQVFKDMNAYLILRELHIWEEDPTANRANENLVSLLISDDPEPGMEDLRKVDIPEDIEERLLKNQKRHDEMLQEEIDELYNKKKDEEKEGKEDTKMEVDEPEVKKAKEDKTKEVKTKEDKTKEEKTKETKTK